MPYKLFSGCVPVKGAQRSIIYDLQRGRYEFIPNDLYHLLVRFEEWTMAELIKCYGQSEIHILYEYFNFLKNKEFIFFTDTPNIFSKLELKYRSASLITNAIIEVGDKSNHDFRLIFHELDELNCQALEIRIFHSISPAEIISILEGTQRGRLRSIVLLLPFSESVTTENLRLMFRANPRISRLCIYDAPQYSVSFVDEYDKIAVLFSPNTFALGRQSRFVNPKYFVCSTEFYVEAQNANPYFNQKIVIDVNGDIKNCSSLSYSYGNISGTSLKEICEREDFQKPWAIKKDSIEICRDCEFRYMCTDERLPVESSNGDYSHTSNCNYDPYSATWDISRLPLS